MLLLETLRPNPAYIISRTLDLLADNPGGLALNWRAMVTVIKEWLHAATAFV